MARETELKKQRVFNTSNGVAKPVWNNANRVNRANHFVPRPVQLNAVKSNVNTGRANVNIVRANVNSVRQNVNSVRTNINTGRSKQPVPTSNSTSFSPVRPQVNKFNQRTHFSKSHSPVRRPIVRNTVRMAYSHAVKGNWGTAIKTSAGSSTQEHVGQRTMTVEDLFHLVPNLITKVDSLETKLKQTKLTMGNVIVKLVKKVKKMEDILKRRHVVLTDLEDEEPEDQGRII
ncbi:hypothetical protein Tco_1222682 [Tanacetum coccineum]